MRNKLISVSLVICMGIASFTTACNGNNESAETKIAKETKETSVNTSDVSEPEEEKESTIPSESEPSKEVEKTKVAKTEPSIESSEPSIEDLSDDYEEDEYDLSDYEEDDDYDDLYEEDDDYLYDDPYDTDYDNNDDTKKVITGGISIDKLQNRQQATLQSSEGKDSVMVYVTYDYFNKLLAAIANQDYDTIGFLYENKLAGVIPNGATCEIIKEDTFTTKVKITSGDFEGAEVIVAGCEVVK